MVPRIEKAKATKLLGKRVLMSFSQYPVKELWRSFMQDRMTITNNVSEDLISLSVYNPHHFIDFDPNREFERWAAVEVTDFNNTPSAMEEFMLPGGLYAVFDYKGLSSDTSIFRYIFNIWLPNSDYLLDQRPHFEILGEKYRNNDPESEEQIWIPIKPKK